jgi:hypothetical protein
MRIDWAALGVVAVVSVTATVIFATLLALGIRFVSVARVRSSEGGSATLPLTAGYAFLGFAALLVLFCLYLIVPQFH